MKLKDRIGKERPRERDNRKRTEQESRKEKERKDRKERS